MQIVLDATCTLRVDIERKQIDIGQFQQMRRLAAGRGTRVEHAQAIGRRQQLGRTLRAGVLHRDVALGESRQRFNSDGGCQNHA